MRRNTKSNLFSGYKLDLFINPIRLQQIFRESNFCHLFHCNDNNFHTKVHIKNLSNIPLKLTFLLFSKIITPTHGIS